jgi:hypothetical protein
MALPLLQIDPTLCRALAGRLEAALVVNKWVRTLRQPPYSVYQEDS